MSSEFVKETAENEIKQVELLHRRFVTGLKEDYGMTDEQILDVEENWLYCGYRREDDEWYDGARQFRYYFPREDFPEFTKECVCRQKLLVRNDWITDRNEVLIIGQCCKDMFIVNRLKTCSICEQPHKNRSDNHCNTCRDKIKKEKVTCSCGNKKKESETQCDECYTLSQKCRCGRKKKRGFKQCYTCFEGSSLDKRNLKCLDLFILDMQHRRWGL